MRKCVIKDYTRFEHEGDPNFLIVIKRYNRRHEKEAKTCDTAILQHFIAYMKVDEKYLAEGQGEAPSVQ